MLLHEAERVSVESGCLGMCCIVVYCQPRLIQTYNKKGYITLQSIPWNEPERSWLFNAAYVLEASMILLHKPYSK